MTHWTAPAAAKGQRELNDTSGNLGEALTPPAGPWPMTAGKRPRPSWIDQEDLDHYVAAFSDPASWSAAIQYYRYGLPFHRALGEHPRPTFELLSERQVAEQWEHPGGLREHPDHPWTPVIGPEDWDRSFDGPTLWMHAAGPDKHDSSYVPEGNPFFDQFPRHYPDLRVRSVGCGHFIPEEAAVYTGDTLIAFAAGRL